MIKDIALKLVITSSKIAGFVFIIFAAAEIFIYKEHQIALSWGLLSAMGFGIKNVAQVFENKSTP